MKPKLIVGAFLPPIALAGLAGVLGCRQSVKGEVHGLQVLEIPLLALQRKKT